MAYSSRKASRVFFHSKEATAGTADSYQLFEGKSCIVTFPTPTYLKESNRNKIGSGEHGTDTETQALFTPFSIKCSRLSEVAFLLSYCTGKADTVYTVSSGVYNHELEHLAVTSFTLPTFTFAYGNTTTAMAVFKYAVINSFSITLGAGGNGVIDATFNGFANAHYVSSGVLTLNATENLSGWTSAYDTLLLSEPLLNYKACKLYYASALESTPLVQSTVVQTASDLGSSTDISASLNSITFSVDNGITGEDILRAGGSGVINDSTRKARTCSLEMSVRKDVDWHALALADTNKAFELQFQGPMITGAYPFGANFFWPKAILTNVTEDDEHPINNTLTFDVYQDTDATAFAAYFWSAWSTGYNATVT